MAKNDLCWPALLERPSAWFEQKGNNCALDSAWLAELPPLLDMPAATIMVAYRAVEKKRPICVHQANKTALGVG